VAELKFLLASSGNKLAAADQGETESGHVERKKTPVSTYALNCFQVFPPKVLQIFKAALCCVCAIFAGWHHYEPESRAILPVAQIFKRAH
jgi:hypothetical protein